MFDELTKYKHHGNFGLMKDQKLVDVCNAPEEAGVYYILMLRKGKVDLVYIGASGTMNQNGKFSKQLLKGRLTKGKQDGVLRQHYFTSMFLLHYMYALDIYWFVTYDNYTQDLPMYVEGVLMQKYFEIHGCLPLWNKEF